MKDRKASLNLYSPCDWKAVERHLTRMAAKGWRLEYVGHACWHYRRSAPAAVHYAVTWLPGLSAYAPEPTVEEADLSELCAAAGWLLLTKLSKPVLKRCVQRRPFLPLSSSTMNIPSPKADLSLRWSFQLCRRISFLLPV